LPLLVKRGYRGPVHCTGATADVADLILRDSAAIQMEDSARFNTHLRRAGEPAAQPLYDDRDAAQVLRQMTATEYNQIKTIADGITIKFINSGHILGAASVQMTIVDGTRSITIVFSGDVGVCGSPILQDPTTPTPADVVLLESTYGDRDHKPLPATRDELLAILQKAQADGAKVIVPAFAVGRTQDLIFYVGEFLREGKLKSLNAYVDSPMASSISKLYANHHEGYDARASELLAQNLSPLDFPGLHYIRTVEESKRLNDAKGFMIIISASGMCTGGRILHHLHHNLNDPRTQVLIVGYQAQGSLGRQLVDGVKNLTIFGDEIAVKATVHTLGGFSAHAGQSGLVAWAAPFQQSRPRMFLTHGEDGPRTALFGHLKTQFGLEPGMPKYGDVVEL
jgi:metallo-beta-lactamase family protein